MKDKITWLIPVLNGMPYIRRTLASLSNPDIGGDCDVYIWDNGSADGTIQEIEKWIPSKINGKIFQGMPMTVGGALRNLVLEARTPYCARIDADDIPAHGRLQKQLDFLEMNPEVAAVGGQMTWIDENGAILDQSRSYPLSHEQIVLDLFCAYNPMPHPAMLLRRDHVLEAGNYRDLPNVEDYDLWIRLSKKYRLACLPIVVTYYRIHRQSCTQQAIKTRRLKDLLWDVLIKI
jgi:glycosyltransferase involved in cell wall biosynthesis